VASFAWHGAGADALRGGGAFRGDRSVRLRLFVGGQDVNRFTDRQGQYLAFIYYYTKLHRRPPAEADIQGYFRVSAPTVHQMFRVLEKHAYIERTPGKPRSIRLLVDREQLPDLD